jgi:hypothetical protein
VKVMLSQIANAIQNWTSAIAQRAQQRTVETQTHRYALVLAVELPTGFSGSLRSPVGDLSSAEGAHTSEVARLCRIIYHDGSVPSIPVPTRVGTAAIGMDHTLIECHRDEDRIAYAADLTLPIPAPGDIVVIRYEDPENCMGPIYDRMHQETANPGTAAQDAGLSLLGGSSPFTSLESYSSSEEAIAALLSFIAKGEGGYNSMNQGTVNDVIIGSTNDASTILGKNLTEMTMAEVQAFQAHEAGHAQRLFAAGRYQIIPGTMVLALRNSEDVSSTSIFNEATQDILGTTLIFNGQRPDLSAYLQGRSNDLNAAMLDMAMEWASIPDPRTGNSYHGSGNRAQHTVAEVSAALQSARTGTSGGT